MEDSGPRSFCRTSLAWRLPFSSGGTNRNELDDDGDWHPDEAKEHAGEPLETGERRRVRKLAEELDHDELEDDRAGEDTHEDIVLQHALQHIELLHLPRTYLIEHLREAYTDLVRVQVRC